MKKKKGNYITLLLFLILLAGLSLLLYPSVSDYWNSLHQTRAIATYAEEVANLNQDQYDEIWAAAESYNASLTDRVNAYLLSDAQKEEYQQLLNVSGLGVMGYIEIPSIDCSLPIYHGTKESVLQIAVGHLEWSSLPVGGESTHCVLSGHRGLPSAKLFTNLDKLQTGDIFMLRVLDNVLTYEVDQILIVEPQETGARGAGQRFKCAPINRIIKLSAPSEAFRRGRFHILQTRKEGGRFGVPFRNYRNRRVKFGKFSVSGVLPDRRQMSIIEADFTAMGRYCPPKKSGGNK